MPKFSVISVIYNLVDEGRIDHFKQAVQSIADQSFTSIEHVVVDGASKDGTVEIIKNDPAFSNIDQFISEPDKGIYDAMNKGVEAANGEYILFLNSDDYYHDLYGFAKMSALLDASKCDYIYAPHRMLSLDGSSWVIPTKMKRIFVTMPFGHPGLGVKKQVFQALGGFDLSFKLAADYDFILRMIKAGSEGCYLESDFVTFRLGGFSSNVQLDCEEKVQIYNKHYSKFQKFDMCRFDKVQQKNSHSPDLLWKIYRSKEWSQQAKKLALAKMPSAVIRHIFP